MTLTTGQRNVLDALHIDRLTDSVKDADDIKNFKVKPRGANLLDYLQNANCALKDNEEQTNAVFFVRDKDGDVLLYFTLKCGALHRLFDASILELTNRLDEYKSLSQLAKGGDENAKWALNQRMPFFQKAIDLFKQLLKKGSDLAVKIQAMLENREQETNTNNMNVYKSHSAIEMAQFCTNEAFKEKYKELFYPNTLGATIFWYKIVPHVLGIAKYVGLEYLYIFAADSTPNKQLVGYYNTTLGFEEPEDIGTTRPFYDSSCVLMSQKISDLPTNRKNFFENFNPDGDEA